MNQVSQVSDEVSASVADARSAIDGQTGPADIGTSSSPATTVNVNIGSAWREPKGIGVGAAVLLAAGASVASVMFVRRRARARVRKLAWLAVRAALVRAMLPRAAQVGGVGGGLLAAAVLQNRLRHRQPRTTLEELRERITAMETQADTRHLLSDRPRPRDLVLGAVVGLVVAGIVGRAKAGRSSD